VIVYAAKIIEVEVRTIGEVPKVQKIHIEWGNWPERQPREVLEPDDVEGADMARKGDWVIADPGNCEVYLMSSEEFARNVFTRVER
jgi:hypothetical protein